MPLEDTRSVLVDVTLNTPHCSFVNILAAFGHPYPHDMGGDCVYHSLQIQSRLNDVVIRRAGASPHHAAFQTCDGDLFLLDSHLGSIEPINVSRVLKDGIAVSGLALPIRDTGPSQIIVTREAEGVIRVSYESVFPFQERKNWLFNLEVPVVRPSLEDRSFAGRDQNGFYYTRYPAEGGLIRFSSETSGLAARLTEVDLAGSSIVSPLIFREGRRWDESAKKLGLEANRLREVLSQAAEAYDHLQRQRFKEQGF